MTKPSIPKGTRDFSPEEMSRRDYMFDTIRSVFRAYGFAPLETPAMENLSTLLGKYGEEGDKLLFKVLNSGDFAVGLTPEDLTGAGAESVPARVEAQRLAGRSPQPGEVGRDDRSPKPTIGVDSNKLSLRISEKGLRYDLTVPFARYVVQHRDQIAFPFRRYQIQPVWRADRPQRGRYREFYQCDVDVIGTGSLLCEVELVQIVAEVFRRLDIAVILKLNNRKILAGIAHTIGQDDKLVDITVAIDKLEKIGLEAVNAELAERGVSQQAIAKLKPILELSGSNQEQLEKLKTILAGSDTGLRGIEEMERIFAYVSVLNIDLDIRLDLSLARGLNYYTGAIFEVKARDFEIGSICGGGRYDDLTGIFGLSDTSGVGISLGADRIYDVLTGLDLFPKESSLGTRALFVNFGEAEELQALKTLAQLRAEGIAAEIYPEPAKMKKQMEYANRRSIPYVVIIGSYELDARAAKVKNMATGEECSVPFGELAAFFRAKS